MKKRVETIIKQRGKFSKNKNFQVLSLSLRTEDIFQVHGQNRPVTDLPVVDFRSQPQEMPLPKPLNK